MGDLASQSAQIENAADPVGVTHQMISGYRPAQQGLEMQILRAYLQRQFEVLTRRHPFEDAILLRVLADFHQHAASQAKQRRAQTARRELHELDALKIVNDPELESIYSLTALPAWALVHWVEGDSDVAIQCLRDALKNAAELAGRYGHDYLTARRIYLASNIARVLLSVGQNEEGSKQVCSLNAVLSGSRDSWLFEDATSLDLPVTAPESLYLRAQLVHLVEKAAAFDTHPIAKVQDPG